jgi:leucyl/phenylalanyl-tRNA---protein transferase
VPADPGPSRWSFGDPKRYDPDDDLVGIGADLEPGTLVAAYREGLFPMPSGPPDPRARSAPPPAWFCPVRRGVLPLSGLRVTRSLRRSRARFQVRVNTSFADVVDGCADRRRKHGWIDGDIRAAYLRLHELGWAHSVETWRDGQLVGGLYGVAIGGLFAGESMFFRETDASKVALVGLVELLQDDHGDDRLIDVQWRTPHLATLGVVEITRADYLSRLPALGDVPPPRFVD